jgi:hypothetical protein
LALNIVGTTPNKSVSKSVLSSADEVSRALGQVWLPRIYKDEVLTERTRSFHIDFPSGKPKVSILHTLLGVELKIGAKRVLCPDLATARYLSVFARAGCPDVAIPYDITRISGYADSLESSWQRMLLLVEHLASDRSRSFRVKIRKVLVDQIRELVKEAGAGTPIPKFKESTRQRKRF